MSVHSTTNTAARTPGWLGAGSLIGDGGMGTELEKHGLGASSPSCWRSIEHPQIVERIQRAYVEAGSRLLLTNTFGANRIMLGRRNSPHGVKEINEAAVAIARRAAGDGVTVLGNISSTGTEEHLLLGGGGKSSQQIADEAYAAFREQATILEAAGVDGILVETMSYLREAVLAVSAAVEHTKLPVLCTMTFKVKARAGGQEFRTYWGDGIGNIVKQLTDAGACGLGANCGDVVDEMPALAEQMHALTPLPLMFEINAGLPVLNERQETTYNLDPQRWAEIAAAVVDRGARIIGGCCGTSPEHIGLLRAILAAKASERGVGK
ncbi:MAG: homocysteine S-methyltransferase family protein [Planctomycetes bacterium]|nr:homocysteine S-methyltransferase family protein [Planctomycetota bacterium]